MKLILLFFLCIFSVATIAQLPKKTSPYNFQRADTFKKFKGNQNALQELKDYLQQKTIQKNLLAGKQGAVVLLPQDHMPCMVPDTRNLVPIPNAWGTISNPYVAPGNSIPNPALPKNRSFSWDVLNNGCTIPKK